MAPVDVAWLRMDHPTNLMLVTGLLSFDRRLDPNRLAAVIDERLLAFDRFRQRVVRRGFPLKRLCWETDPRFDLSSHLQQIALPSPGDEAALREVIGQLMSTPLDATKPLWQFHLIEDYRGGCAVLVRIHHCIADGMALMHVLLSLTDRGTTPGAAGYPPVHGERARRPEPLLGVPASLRRAYRLATCLWRRGTDVLSDPRQVLEMARLGASGAAATGHLLLRPADPITVLKGELGVPKRAAWSQSLPLAKIKSIAGHAGATVNDVLLAAVTGALRRYLVARGQSVDGLEVHAAVPVNLRSSAAPRGLGNEFGLVFVALPLGLEDPVERLLALRQQMNELKESPEAGVALRILGALGTTPAELQKLFVEFVGRKTTAVITNVAGPADAVRLAGARVRSMMFWVPMSGRVGLGFSILSYDGQVRLGVASDRGLVPEPETIAAGFEHELARLVRATREAELETA